MKYERHHTKRHLPTDRVDLTQEELDVKITECLDLIGLRFRRVADRLTLMLGTAEFELAMRELVVDDRGGRQGFPPRVLKELLTLSNLHDKRYGHFNLHTTQSVDWFTTKG